ncbi:MAG: ATP-dependent DNA helicase RecG [Candidatus Berkelbacteria bacterium]|nr:ATP-dependent DNA helicase RecG [Candidatus Berkelbacteria bacterium]
MRTISKKNQNYDLNLNMGVDRLYNVGRVLSLRLRKLGIRTIKDLLLHFPSRYEDLSSIKPIVESRPGESATFKGKLLSISSRRSKNRRMNITEAIISDDTSTLKVIFFNQPFLTRFFKIGDTLVLAGKVDFKPYLGRYLSNPVYEKSTNPLSPHLGRIVPIYPETRGISSKWLRSKIKPLLKLSSKFKDPLPLEIKDSLDLIDFDEAIRQIHFPDFHQSLKAAIHRLAFDELFIIALRTEILKNKLRSLSARRMRFKEKEVTSFVKNLPFKLTDAQRRSAWEIIKDLDNTRPMNRLLNGDVGSGKTIVAAIAALCVYLNGKQTAIMAPTEVLAYQHYQNFVKFFQNYDLEIELLTNSYHLSSKNNIMPKNKYLTSDIIIGTHALIQKGIKFKDLALAIIDEQHRFGVKQRAQIKKNNLKGETPHLLSMTATPIPRTLSLALYGDLDISILDEYPKDRKEIKTYLVPPTKRGKAYDFIKNEIEKGRQIFVICPLIEKKERKKDSVHFTFDFDSRKAAIEEYEKLKNSIFPELKIGLLHGRMRSNEKEKIMNQFKDKKLDILVSTSVIEVGVDIPNATVIMIEGAERFGLSQLHQFRGRVGRDKYKSYCFLFTESAHEETKARLKVIAETSNGFKIAEADLKLRGPGEIYGERQHGIANLRFASLFDYRLIKEAKTEAEKLIQTDPRLISYPMLRNKLQQFEKETHLE